MLVTIALGHPLGVVMTLQTGNDEVRFKPAPLEGADVKSGEVEPSLLVLDGQQRLTVDQPGPLRRWRRAHPGRAQEDVDETEASD